MMTLTASPKTTRTTAPVTLVRGSEPAAKPQTRPSFWRTLLRALAAPAF